MAPRWAARSVSYWYTESGELLGRRTPHGHDRRSDTGMAARTAFYWT